MARRKRPALQPFHVSFTIAQRIELDQLAIRDNDRQIAELTKTRDDAARMGWPGEVQACNYAIKRLTDDTTARRARLANYPSQEPQS